MDDKGPMPPSYGSAVDQSADPLACRNEPSVPYLNNGVGLLLALVLVTITLAGALSAVMDPNPFWLGFALWALFIAFLPALEHRNVRNLAPWWILVPISWPFIVNMAGMALGLQPLGFDSPLSWLVESIALFALCLTTMVFIDARGEMRMSGLFLTTVTFLFFETVLVIQGWVSWYSDLGLGTDLVPRENEYMVFFVLSTISGLVLAFFVDLYLRRRSNDEFKERVTGKGWG
jgi:hypothetical protein